MADGTSVSHDGIVCRYFLSATCKDGEKCLFSHDRSRRIPDNVCRYYLNGACAFGEQCWYSHIPLSEMKAKSNSGNLLADDSKRSANVFGFATGNVSKGKEIGNSALNKKSTSTPSNWINAPEFVPKNVSSYADIVKVNTALNNNNHSNDLFSKQICPFFTEEDCQLPNCPWNHGTMCDLCQKACLHPFDDEARRLHIEECERKLEQNMEFSFAVQRSMDKTCGICMDVVLEKEPVTERKFGVLEKCNHIYCLGCIRKWRRSARHDDNLTRACPECRTVSNFVIPNDYVVDTEEAKQKLIIEYKDALSKMHCRYFKRGEGECPFGRSCFYLHARPDGTKVDVPFPSRRRRQNQDGIIDFITEYSLFEFLESRDENGLVIFEHIDELSSDIDDTASNSSDDSTITVWV